MADCQALIRVADAVGSKPNTNFDPNCCANKFITCTDNRITQIDAMFFGPQPGVIPSDIQALTKLQKLKLNGPFIKEISGDIGNLQELKELWLQDNRLETLPEGFFNLKLQILVLRNNTIKLGLDWLTKMPTLKRVFLGENQFYGSIPESIGALKDLEVLDLHNNPITGDLTSLGQLQNLLQFSIENTNINGTIPPELSRFNPRQVVLNDKVSGPLPWKQLQLLEKCSDIPGGCCKLNDKVCRISSIPDQCGSVATCPGYTDPSPIPIAAIVGTLVALLLFTVLYLYRKRKLDPFSSGSSTQTVLNPQVPFFKIEESQVQYLDRLGQGEFSTVFKAKINGELVAVKKYKQQSSQDEIQIMRGIIHANVVSIYGLVLGDKPGIVMELLDCTLLDAYHTQTISELEKTQISSDIASAMAFLHLKSVIHRDLKPSNILLDSNKKAKISDFGFSIVDADSSQLVGTIQYMAPEILEARKYSQQSDVYAFAIVFWEILHWKRAYEHIDMHQVRSSILDGDRLPLDGLDPDKQLLLNAMWQQDPSHRPLFQDICPILFQEQPLDSTITPPMSVFVPGSERYESADNFQMQDLFFKLNQLSSSRFKTNFPSLNTSQTSFRSNNSAYC